MNQENIEKYKGLTTEEVLNKQKSGRNAISKPKKDSIFKIFISQFFDSIIIIMIIAFIVSLSINEILDALVILFIILLDVGLGTFEEWKFGKNSETLENMIKVTTFVLRDDEKKELNSEELVVDDIIFLQSGDRISADAVILSCHNFTVDEAILTGESVSNHKHAKIDDNLDSNNTIFAGTSVMTGRAIAQVIKIGVDTEIGHIAKEVSKIDKTKTPLTIRIKNFSKRLSVIILILSVFLIFLLFIKGFNFSEIILLVVSLTVSTIPEGLPLALTLALTIGSNRMYKKNVIVKKLKSVESLGSCTVIASDKTGTLTVNEQTAKKIVFPNNMIFNITGTGYNNYGRLKEKGDISEVLEISKLGVVNNEASLEFCKGKWISSGDSIDIAFLSLGEKLKINKDKLDVMGIIPYESENKYAAVFYKEDDIYNCTVKGSLEVVLEFCDFMYEDDNEVKLNKELIISQNEALAKDGYRVIALAKNKLVTFAKKDFYTKDDIPKLVFVGLVAFIDPIRENALDAVDRCREAGIKVIMITGDHPLTSYAIGLELDLISSFDEVTSGDETNKYLSLGNDKFDDFVKSKKIFTRVTPMQKLEIVKSLKRQGEFVAVTGDGVNDALALKTANIGIAMGSGTDVARETSNMIITDDKFLSIVSGIEEGRNAYSNIRKVIYMLVSCGLAEVLFFIIAIILNMPMPLIAIQLLWLNVVTDGLQDLALSFEKMEVGAMKNKPRSPNEPLFDGLLIKEIVIAGVTMGIIVFILWYILINILNMEISLARGYIMTLMVFMQNIHVLNCRSERESVFKISFKSNPLIIFSILSSIILQIIVMKVPFISNLFKILSIPFSHIFILFIMALPILFIMELFKKFNKKG